MSETPVSNRVGRKGKITEVDVAEIVSNSTKLLPTLDVVKTTFLVIVGKLSEQSAGTTTMNITLYQEQNDGELSVISGPNSPAVSLNNIPVKDSEGTPLQNYDFSYTFGPILGDMVGWKVVAIARILNSGETTDLHIISFRVVNVQV